jgi:hypothetical protein
MIYHDGCGLWGELKLGPPVPLRSNVVLIFGRNSELEEASCSSKIHGCIVGPKGYIFRIIHIVKKYRFCPLI